MVMAAKMRKTKVRVCEEFVTFLNIIINIFIPQRTALAVRKETMMCVWESLKM